MLSLKKTQFCLKYKSRGVRRRLEHCDEVFSKIFEKSINISKYLPSLYLVDCKYLSAEANY